jgi:hypothetical protein
VREKAGARPGEAGSVPTRKNPGTAAVVEDFVRPCAVAAATAATCACRLNRDRAGTGMSAKGRHAWAVQQPLRAAVRADDPAAVAVAVKGLETSTAHTLGLRTRAFADAVHTAASLGHERALGTLLQTTHVAADMASAALVAAARAGHVAAVVRLLCASAADPARDAQSALVEAVTHHRAAVVHELLADARVDPCARAQWAIRTAARTGDVAIVRLLLDDGRVDPAADADEPLREAAANGHAEVVRLLLADQRVDPTVYYNGPLRYAAAGGFEAVVTLLLADPRVDPADDRNGALRSARVGGHAAVEALLLADERVRGALAE